MATEMGGPPRSRSHRLPPREYDAVADFPGDDGTFELAAEAILASSGCNYNINIDVL